MTLERGSLMLSWCLLTLAFLPVLLAAAYWISLLVPLFTPAYQWSTGQGTWILIITGALLLLGTFSVPGWKILIQLRHAVHNRESPPTRVWLNSLLYNLCLFALSLLLPWAFGWHEDDQQPLLVFLLYGLPLLLAIQVWLAAMGWWTTRTPAAQELPKA